MMDATLRALRARVAEFVNLPATARAVDAGLCALVHTADAPCLYDARVLDAIIEAACGGRPDLRRAVHALLESCEGKAPATLRCPPDTSFYRLRDDLAQLEAGEFSQLRELLLAASEEDDRYLIGEVLDMLHETTAQRASRPGRLSVVPALSVSGGRIAVGNAATVRGPLAPRTLLPHIYPAIFTEQTAASNWAWESVHAILCDAGQLEPSEASSRVLFDTRLGRAAMADAISYDVMGQFGPVDPRTGKRWEWTGLGAFYRSPLGAMNDPRGVPRHLDFLHRCMQGDDGEGGGGPFAGLTPAQRGEAEDAWVRDALFARPGVAGRTGLPVECGLEFLSIAGCVPIVVGVCTHGVRGEQGEEDGGDEAVEASFSYGSEYWKFKAFFPSPIDWLATYKGAVHGYEEELVREGVPCVNEQGAGMRVVRLEEGVTPRAVALVVRTLTDACGGQRTCTASSLHMAPGLHERASSSDLRILPLYGHVDCVNALLASRALSHAAADVLCPGEASGRPPLHLHSAVDLPLVLYAAPTWYDATPPTVPSDQEAEAYVEHALLFHNPYVEGGRSSPAAVHRAFLAGAKGVVVVHVLLSSLQDARASPLPALHVLRMEDARHTAALLAYALNPAPNDAAGDDGARTSGALGFGGPLHPCDAYVAGQHPAVLQLHRKFLAPPYLSAFLRCLHAVARVLHDGGVTPTSSGGKRGGGRGGTARRPPPSTLPGDMQQALEEAMDSALHCSRAGVVRADVALPLPLRRARSQVLNLWKAGQLQGLTPDVAPPVTRELVWEDVQVEEGDAVVLAADTCVLRFGARVKEALCGTWLAQLALLRADGGAAEEPHAREWPPLFVRPVQRAR